jgi:hypothetical protein
MEEQVEKPADGSVTEPVPRTNPGRFRRGDPRINREGRPRGRKAASEQGVPVVDQAPFADRLMLLTLPQQDFVGRLAGRNAIPIRNLPPDAEIVVSRVCPTRGVVLVVRSQTFARVAKGTPIPALAPRSAGNARVFMPKKFADRFLRSMDAAVPEDARIVACSWDDARLGAVFQVRTQAVPAVPIGKPLPEFSPR